MIYTSGLTRKYTSSSEDKIFPTTGVADPDPFDTELDPAFHLNTDPGHVFFNLIRIRSRPFDTDPDPYHFKEVMYLKQYFLHTLT